mgnify:CR=1 FL=1
MITSTLPVSPSCAARNSTQQRWPMHGFSIQDMHKSESYNTAAVAGGFEGALSHILCVPHCGSFVSSISCVVVHTAAAAATVWITGTLSRILSSPTGAEVTGPSLQFSGGKAYITWAVQHPQDWEGEKLPRDAQEVGVLGGGGLSGLSGKGGEGE